MTYRLNQLLQIGKDMQFDTLEQAYFDYQRHYDLFFDIDKFEQQNNDLTDCLKKCGLVELIDGKLLLKEVSVDEALKIVNEIGVI